MIRIPPDIRLLTMRMMRPTLESHTDSDAHQNLWLGKCIAHQNLWLGKHEEDGAVRRKISTLDAEVNAWVQEARQAMEKGKHQ